MTPGERQLTDLLLLFWDDISFFSILVETVFGVLHEQ